MNASATLSANSGKAVVDLQFFLNNPLVVSTTDTDRDGLYDAWERYGIPYPTTACPYYALYKLPSAHPGSKDLYVELDAMQDLTPSDPALSKVMNAFSGRGVSLHIVPDEYDISARSYTGNPFTTGQFLADQRFGARDERELSGGNPNPDWPAIKAAKAKAYRYCLYADSCSLTPTQSLQGATPGPVVAATPKQFFVVFKGAILSRATRYGAQPGDPRLEAEEAATFMHEFGHTLGLLHGGGDNVNFKPNYRSVMNYLGCNAFLPFPKVQFTLDYSNLIFPQAPLDPNALVERDGLGGFDKWRWVVIGPPPTDNFWTVIPEAGCVEWDDESPADCSDTVPRHIRDFGGSFPPDGFPWDAPLYGYNDWAHLVYAPPGQPPSAPTIRLVADPGATPNELSNMDEDFTSEMKNFFSDMETDCNRNGVADRIDVANGTAQDVNANGFPDECEGSPTDVPASTAATMLRLTVLANPTGTSRPTRFALMLPSAAPATLAVFDAAGRKLATVVSENMPAGQHEVAWSGKTARGEPVPAGIYFAELRVGARSVKVKFVILR